MKIRHGLLLLLFPALALAVPPPEVQVPETPEASIAPPTGVDPGLEPDVRIIQRKDARVEEYRLDGQLYMVKVTPTVGPPYYLYDTTGDGTLDSRRNELDPGLVVPRWMIFRW